MHWESNAPGGMINDTLDVLREKLGDDVELPRGRPIAR
jgi:hypothetical protein